jgi:pimeloyl-ACP methyl ester carboxylesterase
VKHAKFARLALTVVSCVAMASVSVASNTASAGEQPPGGVPGVPIPTLEWTDCGDGYQCAAADLPLDYRNLAGPTITIQLRKWPAADPSRKIGTLFLHSGGPGGSAWDWTSEFAPTTPQEMQDRFDIIGFDPRGVRRSRAVQCIDPAPYREQYAQTSTRVHPGSFDDAVRFATEFDQACKERSSALLPYIGTEAVARDLDVLREAVGDEKLTFFGLSFGTYVGTVYANMFPQRTRALVLDGPYDPNKYANDPYQYDYDQFVAVDKALHRFFDWCTATPSQCEFSGGDPEARFRAIMDDLDANPIRDASGAVTVNGATFLQDALFRLNGGTRDWSRIGTNLALAENREGPLMYVISDSDVVFNAANVSVECADKVYPTGLNELRRRLTRVSQVAPLTAPGQAYGPPAYDQTHGPACSQWTAERKSIYRGPYTARGSAPILVVGNTGDADTPYPHAVALTKTLKNGHLVTWVGEGHTARRKSACAAAYMYEYLLRVTVPPAGATCTDAPIPALNAAAL